MKLKKNPKKPSQTKASCDYCQQIISHTYLGKNYCGVKCALSWGINNFSQLLTQKNSSLSLQVKRHVEELGRILEETKKDIDVLWNSPEKLRWVVENGTKLESSLSREYWVIWKTLKYACEQRINELSSSQPVPNETFNGKNNQEEYIDCQQCFKEIKSGKDYWYHKSKNDGHKFCSTKCYDDHYGEYCNKFVKKFLTTYQWENNPYCYNCYELVKQESKDQEWNPIIYCRYCSVKTELFEVCDKESCLAKMNQEIEEKKNGNQNNNKENNNTIERERERERERTNSNHYEPITVWNHSVRS